ncbi:hypothetical protein D623_10003419 [Myotis brandtii]|uniref:Uncharacterized protein n=1 Tax=Myotis brandtii TaxID=109478 RepID=S7P3G1_MYOBR|nr:hypothetical protein D623_10003419 [Myotis brandtii]
MRRGGQESKLMDRGRNSETWDMSSQGHGRSTQLARAWDRLRGAEEADLSLQSSCRGTRRSDSARPGGPALCSTWPRARPSSGGTSVPTSLRTARPSLSPKEQTVPPLTLGISRARCVARECPAGKGG